MKKSLTLAMVSLCATPVLAANNTIFSCTADNGNKISVAKNGSDYVFVYGKTTFKNPVKQVLANQDSYVATGSSFTTSSLEMKNNGMSYTIQFVQARNGNAIEEPTLYINHSNKMDTISCKTETATQNFERRNMKSS
ncbi:hypothetical protein BKG92_07560 [Rodentibacter ratti]|uniref:Lysozyme inhibitor n=2 Tax=Rodentibacter ratti TaxID=1906745 RepID=A0A1V3KY08_9PAST|nr:hypothetical protein BKG92_07560 [Rodentibacter ratti]